MKYLNDKIDWKLPTKNNLSILHCVQLAIMAFLAFQSFRHLLISLKYFQFSLINIIIITIDLLVVTGFVLEIYGIVTEKVPYIRCGLRIFLLGYLGIFFIYIIYMFKFDISPVDFVNLAILLLISFLIYKQSKADKTNTIDLKVGLN